MQSCVPIGNAHNNVPLRAEEISRTGARSTRNGVCETLKVSNIHSGLRHLKMTRNDVKWQAKLKAELEYLGPRDMFILQLDAFDMSRFGWPTPDIETFAGLDNKMLTIKLCFFFCIVFALFVHRLCMVCGVGPQLQARQFLLRITERSLKCVTV